MNDILELIVAKTKPLRDIESINKEDELGALGIDSLNFLLLILDLEAHTQQNIFKPENIAELKTVGDILSKIEHCKSEE
ncbi:phosphopantetheine-binding protein [Aquimarina sediminis]|uniref:phosphopantetheine-binding protein n=1 Tax=Aquimarina sediminis TaxID=2070536 RepID=UPI000CA077B7|nr:phosphopantetheine-binding protein [Aquimarina sediminis]